MLQDCRQKKKAQAFFLSKPRFAGEKSGGGCLTL